MRKSTKVLLKTAGIMAALGLVFSIIGIAMGGQRNLEQWMGGRFRFRIGGWDIGSNVEWNNDYPIVSGDITNMRVSDTEHVTRLKVENGSVNLRLQVSADGQFHVEGNDAPSFQCYTSGDTLYLKSRTYTFFTFFSFGSSEKENEIVLYVPQGYRFEEADFEVGGGVISVEELYAEQVRMEAGAGEISVDRMEADTLRVEVGAGEVNIRQTNVRKADLDVGVGELRFSGRITEDMDAKCAVGQMRFDLEEAENAHNYVVECAIGSVQIGNSSYSGLSTGRNINNGQTYTYTLNCSIGEIDMNFREAGR